MQPPAANFMLSVFWDAQSVIAEDFLQKVTTITGTYFTNLIQKQHNLFK